MTRVSLPVDPYLDEILALVRRHRAAVVTAEPGAGKTTRIAPALTVDGPVILLQPRRLAARAIAQRIAAERGWTIGHDVGWQVRFERRFGPRTRLLVATEGILTARLQQDPLLSDFRTIVLDEFHERSVHADLGLALARQAWRARDDLRLVVMSATLDTGRVAAYLDDCPIVEIPGRLYPVEMSYAPTQSLRDALDEMLAATRGDILCFLPGAPEIRRAIGEIETRGRPPDIDVVPLHGSLDADAQSAVLAPAGRRRIVVATNIAETSLTVPGVTTVIDTGLHKVARYDPSRGIDSLDTERITADSADQRAGRAGRLGPGLARRLWDARDRLRPHREPEIVRIDLAAAVLDVLPWGGDPHTVEWFEPPPRDAVEAAFGLLARLGAVRDGRLTSIGDVLHRLPVHPRLGRILVEANGAPQAAAACALLSERHFLPPRAHSTTCDLLSALDDWGSAPGHIRRVADEIARLARAILRETRKEIDEDAFRRALLSGYADRVARRRAPGSSRVLLASGQGAVVAESSGVRSGEFLVALDVQGPAEAGRHGSAAKAGRHDSGRSAPRGVASGFSRTRQAPRGVASGFSRTRQAPRGVASGFSRTRQAPRRVASGFSRTLPAEAMVRVASQIERAWLAPTRSEVVHTFVPETGAVRAAAVDFYDAIALGERPVPPDPTITAQLLADAYLERGLADADGRLLRRLRFAGHDLDVADLVRRAAAHALSLAAIDLEQHLPPAVAAGLDRLAPETLPVPSGRRVRLDYEDEQTVVAHVKLQEIFGLADTPRIGPRKTPVVFELLAPNGRPVQRTRDLRSFWARTYPDVRKELRGRYPRHPWPEDPWTATPTHRTKKRSRQEAGGRRQEAGGREGRCVLASAATSTPGTGARPRARASRPSSRSRSAARSAPACSCRGTRRSGSTRRRAPS